METTSAVSMFTRHIVTEGTNPRVVAHITAYGGRCPPNCAAISKMSIAERIAFWDITIGHYAAIAGALILFTIAFMPYRYVTTVVFAVVVSLVLLHGLGKQFIRSAYTARLRAAHEAMNHEVPPKFRNSLLFQVRRSLGSLRGMCLAENDRKYPVQIELVTTIALMLVRVENGLGELLKVESDRDSGNVARLQELFDQVQQLRIKARAEQVRLEHWFRAHFSSLDHQQHPFKMLIAFEQAIDLDSELPATSLHEIVRDDAIACAAAYEHLISRLESEVMYLQLMLRVRLQGAGVGQLERPFVLVPATLDALAQYIAGVSQIDLTDQRLTVN